MKATNINPQFDDLQGHEVFINHIDELRKELNSQKELSSNPFPVHVFPELIKELISATNINLNYPIDFIGSSILYAASVSIGNNCEVEVKTGFRTNAVLYIAIVGKPGTNKSHPLMWALNPLKHNDNANFKLYQSAKREYDRISSLSTTDRKKEGVELPEKPYWEQHLVSDFTLEALAKVHSYNKKGIGVNVDELASWFKNFDRYNKGSEQEFWLSVWSGNSININRKTSEPTNIPKPFISVAGTIQPGVLNELAKNRKENGFMDRMLFAIPDDLKKPYWSEYDLDSEIVEKWKIIIKNILSISNDSYEFTLSDEPKDIIPIKFKFTQDAKIKLLDWQKNLVDLANSTEDDIIKGILAKMEIYTLRFALIIEVLNCACGKNSLDKSISSETVSGSISLSKYFIRTAYKAHSLLSNENPLEGLTFQKQDVLKSLPNEFRTGEGVKIAQEMEVPERTFKYWLKDKKIFERIRQGYYRKKI